MDVGGWTLGEEVLIDNLRNRYVGRVSQTDENLHIESMEGKNVKYFEFYLKGRNLPVYGIENLPHLWTDLPTIFKPGPIKRIDGRVALAYGDKISNRVYDKLEPPFLESEDLIYTTAKEKNKSMFVAFDKKNLDEIARSKKFSELRYALTKANRIIAIAGEKKNKKILDSIITFDKDNLDTLTKSDSYTFVCTPLQINKGLIYTQVYGTDERKKVIAIDECSLKEIASKPVPFYHSDLIVDDNVLFLIDRPKHISALDNETLEKTIEEEVPYELVYLLGVEGDMLYAITSRENAMDSITAFDKNNLDIVAQSNVISCRLSQEGIDWMSRCNIYNRPDRTFKLVDGRIYIVGRGENEEYLLAYDKDNLNIKAKSKSYRKLILPGTWYWKGIVYSWVLPEGSDLYKLIAFDGENLHKIAEMEVPKFHYTHNLPLHEPYFEVKDGEVHIRDEERKLSLTLDAGSLDVIEIKNHNPRRYAIKVKY